MIQSLTVYGFVTPPISFTSTVSRPFLLTPSKAGFGSSSSSNKKTKKEAKLKPKAQWDRYTDVLKKEPIVRVAVQKDGDDEWLEVGRVRSKDNAFTEIAVAKQRALIAAHAHRLYPLQVSAKDKIQWAYWEGTDDDGSWTVVDKKAVEGAPDGIEKQIGFEGRPDPATGFYCVYDGGRLQENK